MKRQVARDGAVLHTLYILSYCSWLHKALHLTLLQISAPTDPNTSGVKASFITNSKHMDDQMTHKLIRQTSPPPQYILHHSIAGYSVIFCSEISSKQTNAYLRQYVGHRGLKSVGVDKKTERKQLSQLLVTVNTTVSAV